MLAASTLISLASLLSTGAYAHGWVGNIIIDGKQYDGPQPVYRAAAAPGPIRQIASEAPITNITSPLLACGGDPTAAASELASATAGSTVSIQWFNGGDAPAWPHNVGPLLTYMAPCSSNTCTDTATSMKFFKIAEDGLVAGGTTWVQAELMNGTRYNVTIPKGIPSGSYIMRHEIVALQNAVSVGGAEHYPSCFQLTVTGGASSQSTSTFLASLGTNETASFPGAYGPNDPGLLLNVYDGATNYDFPGPSIPSILSGGGASSSQPSPSPTKSSTPSVALTTSNIPSATPSNVVHTTSEVKTHSSAPSHSERPNVVVTTMTKVFVLTMTLGDGTAAPRHTHHHHSHSYLSSERPSPTMSPSVTSEPAKRSGVPYGLERRHARRSPSWRATFAPGA